MESPLTIFLFGLRTAPDSIKKKNLLCTRAQDSRRSLSGLFIIELRGGEGVPQKIFYRCSLGVGHVMGDTVM